MEQKANYYIHHWYLIAILLLQMTHSTMTGP